MADVLSTYLRTLDAFDELVHAIKPDDWARPTPCADWNVRELLNHLVGEQLWAPPLLDGKTIADVGDQFDGDVLGEDPVRAWQDAARDARAAFSTPGVFDGTVHLSYADEPAEVYGWQMAMDLLVHGWDLARGINADETMEPEAVTEVYQRVLPMAEALSASGMFGTPVDVGADASPAARLLGLLGRRP